MNPYIDLSNEGLGSEKWGIHGTCDCGPPYIFGRSSVYAL